MTPQQEYIITEDELKKEVQRMSISEQAAWRIRSRPHTPAPAATHFIIDAGLRADVAETLRMAGCPSLACRVLDDTMPDYQINAEREKVLDELLDIQGGATYEKGKDEYDSWVEAIDSLRAQQAGDPQ